MFNLSFSEIFLILIIAVLVLKPHDFPMLIKQAKKLFKQMLAIKNTILDEIENVKNDIDFIEQDLLDNKKIIKQKEKRPNND